MIQNKDTREGFLNRFTTPLPERSCDIILPILTDTGEVLIECIWLPFADYNFSESGRPAKHYIGTAKVVNGPLSGNGYNAWSNTVNDFIFYQLK